MQMKPFTVILKGTLFICERSSFFNHKVNQVICKISLVKCRVPLFRCLFAYKWLNHTLIICKWYMLVGLPTEQIVRYGEEPDPFNSFVSSFKRLGFRGSQYWWYYFFVFCRSTSVIFSNQPFFNTMAPLSDSSLIDR